MVSPDMNGPHMSLNCLISGSRTLSDMLCACPWVGGADEACNEPRGPPVIVTSNTRMPQHFLNARTGCIRSTDTRPVPVYELYRRRPGSLPKGYPSMGQVRVGIRDMLVEASTIQILTPPRAIRANLASTALAVEIDKVQDSRVSGRVYSLAGCLQVPHESTCVSLPLSPVDLLL